jgi:putative prolyl 4-hydroxylase alpha subunit
VLTRVGGQRIGTVVMYLNDVPEGGETAFPDIGFSAKPIKGSAVYFEYQNADGQLDYRCLHAGMPVIRGDKWIMTKWLRERPYEQ